MSRRNDQLVVPAPAVRFATEEAQNTVLGAVYQQFTQAKNTAEGKVEQARQKAEEIAKRQEEINHLHGEIERINLHINALERENTEAHRERVAALSFADGQRAIAKGAGDTLALLGHAVHEDQLDFLRAANWERVEQLHDALPAENRDPEL
ncbi:hypothetical protein [Nonomuraea typhae]|uniref:hypothetical protein n=1 Tax=Nonomuraea typhae TaxID=2603600 RepID=UPI0012FAB68F|nr:hypothetical protein [Nonomuraea typhae]